MPSPAQALTAHRLAEGGTPSVSDIAVDEKRFERADGGLQCVPIGHGLREGGGQ